VRLDGLFAHLGPDALLRPVEDGDVPELFRLVEANRDHLRAWLPWLDSTRAEADLRAWADAEREKAAAGRSVQFAVVAEGRIAGVIGFHEIDWAHGQVELGYWLAEDRQGRGLMTRAAAELVRMAFEELGLNRVGIRTATGNARSRAIPERLGFRHEGVIREGERLYERFVDLDVYGLLASEWRIRAPGQPKRGGAPRRERLRPHPRLRRL
jgi:ribosomal-protein-serine acetyltransferase